MAAFLIPPKVSAAVARAAIETGVARKIIDPAEIEKAHLAFLYEGQLPKIGGSRKVKELLAGSQAKVPEL